jgi:hypothetical protein
MARLRGHAYLRGASAQLGCAVDDGPFGPVVRADAQRVTTVPRRLRGRQRRARAANAIWASADGVTAGIAAHQSLALG